MSISTRFHWKTPAAGQFSRLLVFSLMALCAGAWFYLWRMEADMPGMAEAVYSVPWSLPFGLMILSMWTAMMAAMMIPASMPVVSLVSRLKPAGGAPSWSRPVAFATGYLLVWLAFGSLLSLGQWLLNRLSMSHGLELGPDTAFGAVVLLLAGLYQWSPWKNACLRHCQTPMGFLLSHWRQGSLGALRMGFEHGLFCLGCCWLLMTLMLIGGAMNLVWMFGVTVYLSLERLLPARLRLERISGALLAAAGTLLILRSVPY